MAEEGKSTETPQEEETSKEFKNTVTIEEAGPCRKKVVIEIPEEAIKKATDKQYENLRKDALVPGFRKGRAPRRLLEKRFGKETTEQIKLTLLADAGDSAIKDNEIQTLSEPDIDFENLELPEEGDFKFEFEIEVRPEFDLPKLEEIPVEKTKLEVTEEQIDREIEQMQRWSGIWTPRQEGEIELDDQIIAEVLLKAEDAEEEEKLDNIEIFVRNKGFVGAIPVENLDELLIGAKSGDSKETSVDVPKTFFREEYRGKKVDLKITVKDIKWLKPAELDEALLQKFQVESVEELREKTHDSLQGRLEQQSRTEMTEQIYKFLLANTKFDLPVEVVAEQATSLLQRQYSNLMMRGLPREKIEEQMDQLRAGSEQQAEEQLKTFFLMDKVVEKLDINVTEEEINGHIAQLAIQQGQRPERMREQMMRDGSLAQFRLEVRQSKCIAKLLESAKITEIKPKPAKKAKETATKPAKKAADAKKKQPEKSKTAAKKKTKE